MNRSLTFLCLLSLCLTASKPPQALASAVTTTNIDQPDLTYIYPAYGVLTSGYGWRWGRMHKGIDIAAASGTPIAASAGGAVTYAGWNAGGYGNLVELTHPDGSTTLYAHNRRILVKVGDRVEQGQAIAEMGSTGYSTGPHCHFEIHPLGKEAVDPIAYLPNQLASR